MDKCVIRTTDEHMKYQDLLPNLNYIHYLNNGKNIRYGVCRKNNATPFDSREQAEQAITEIVKQNKDYEKYEYYTIDTIKLLSLEKTLDRY